MTSGDQNPGPYASWQEISPLSRCTFFSSLTFFCLTAFPSLLLSSFFCWPLNFGSSSCISLLLLPQTIRHTVSVAIEHGSMITWKKSFDSFFALRKHCQSCSNPINQSLYAILSLRHYDESCSLPRPHSVVRFIILILFYDFLGGSFLFYFVGWFCLFFSSCNI